MIRILLLSVFAVLTVSVGANADGWDPRVKADGGGKSKERIAEATQTAATFLKDNPSLQIYFDEAYGYAVFPSVRKGGVGIGGARGSGILFKGDTATKRAFLTQYTVGLQFGVKSYSEIIFFRDRDAYDRFEYGELALSRNATAVTIDSSGVLQTSFSEDVAVFVNGGAGMMFEASIGGQNFGTRELN